MADGLRPRRERPAHRPAGDDELVSALVRLGTRRESAEAAVRRGDPESAVFEPVLLRQRLDRTVSPKDIEARGGLPVDEIASVMQGFGLVPPGPSEPTFTPGEAEVLVELHKLREVWPSSLTLQVARVYGEMLARVAGAEVQAFRQYSIPLMRAQQADAVSELEAVQATFEHLLPLADPLLVGVHRRWIEHELAQAAVREAERRVGAAHLPGAVDVAFLFCDLKDFTSYAEVEGDAAAITAIDQFFDVLRQERGDSGRIVKSLGDGAMLAYNDPVEAVAGGARVIAAIRATAIPGVHASVHQGVAIAREGDYFGNSVNISARLLAFGERDELMATSVVVEACAGVFEWEPIGERLVRGLASPLAIYRLRL